MPIQAVMASPLNGPDKEALLAEIINDNDNDKVNGNRSNTGGLSDSKQWEPIAICGLACRLPGGISCPQDLWEFLLAKNDARVPVPESRYKASSHYSTGGKPGSINSEYGYFLDERVNIASLDTSFFSMSKSEMEQMDPQHRQLLEVARECIDDAGEVNWRGSQTGVYAGSFGEDWAEMFTKDSQQYGGYRSTATSDMAISNRISYEMDLRGPSVTIRTGCSASLIGLNEACTAIAKGDCKAAIVGGTSLLLAPGLTATMAKQGVLSPDASCKTFSADANGYARAEGIVAVYVKSVKDALRDGNPIRAVIRGIATNHGGKTAGMTHPSSDAQEALIRRTYNLAGIRSFCQTAYIESHGTGTPTGDPIEAIAIARVFGETGIYMGSIKPNLGHSEGASGLASLIKCVLALENRIIPPNIKFSKPNPKIPFETGKLIVPTEPLPWPKACLERVSLNSFGLGGSNAHVIIEAAPNTCSPENTASENPVTKPHLLLYSANSLESLERMTETYNSYLRSNLQRKEDLAYTLANGREHLPYRTSVIAGSDGAISISPLTKTSSPAANVVMAFTGQGAQWPQMGRDLLQWNPVFRESIRSMDIFLCGLGDLAPLWSLETELCKPATSTRLYDAEIAHPALTGLQVALVQTLASFGIKPTAVVGHSGGEVAAAYAAGALTANEAIMVSLYRGTSVKKQTKRGAMAAIGMGWQDTLPFLLPNVNIACHNSPSSVTISGDADQVSAVVSAISASKTDVLTKVLNVDKAYHSPHMVEVGQGYLNLLAGLVAPRVFHTPFFSSVTGKLFQKGDLLPIKYWQQNLESPVLFNTALNCLLRHPLGKNPIFLEVGPHSALSGPLRQILTHNSSSAPYVGLMRRQENCVHTFLAAIGQLFAQNVGLDFRALAPAGRLLPNLPPYPWHHPSSYWHELRTVREWRLRKHAHHDLLGIRITESTDFEPAWKNFLHLDNAPWLRDHVIQGDIIFPLAGYIGLVGEAIRQIDGAEDSFRLRRVHVTTALVLHDGEPTELITTFRRQRLTNSLEGDWWEFTVTSHNGHTWTRHCYGEVAKMIEPLGSHEKQPTLPRKASSQKWYSVMSNKGFHYGPSFQRLCEIRTATTGAPIASAVIRNCSDGGGENNFHIHPTVIDSILQLLFCAETYGICRRYRKLLPTTIESMGISRCLRDVRASVSTARARGSGLVGKGCCVVEDTVVLQMTGLQLSPLEDALDPDLGDGLAARHTWGPHIDFMRTQDLIKPTLDKSAYMPSLNELTQLCLVNSQRTIAGLESTLPPMNTFSKWIDLQISKMDLPLVLNLDDFSIEHRIDQISRELSQTPVACAAFAMSKLCTFIKDIFLGKVQPLDILQEEGLLGRICSLSQYCDISLLLKHLAHSKPNLKVLEIGAGIGAGSRPNLACISLPNNQPLYSRYTITDVSATSLATAREILGGIPNVDFAPLDISRDPKEQGFNHRKYDLIIARNLSNGSSTPRESLLNVRTLLDDNGRLVIHDFSSTPQWANFLWGVLPGWWDSASDSRADDPCAKLALNQWSIEFMSVGFKPPELFTFAADDPLRKDAVMVTIPDKDYRHSKRLTVLCKSQSSDPPRRLMEQLGVRGFSVSRHNLGDHLPVGQDMIALLDEAGPFFQDIDENTFEQFKDLVGSLADSKIMWLTRPCHMDCQDPNYAQVIGISRTLRSEMLLNFATCETRDVDADSEIIADVFTRIQSGTNDDSTLGPDFEFVISGGTAKVGRFYPFSLSKELLTKNVSEELILKLPGSGRRGTVQWASKPTASMLKGDDVEVVTHAMGLNFVDVLTRMGVVELSEPNLGLEASGVVRSVGPGVRNLRVGDRVMLAGRSTFSSSIVLSELLCAKIPDEMSFIEAATMPIVYGTAIQAIMNVGRLEKGQSILIHSGCGGVGLAAIQVAQMLEAEIFVTVSTEEKVEHLVKTMHIPRNRIFNSRNTSFVNGIMQETQGRGVDLALNSLSGKLLHETWRCIAEFGMMVEIGKRDLIGAGKLDMDVFLANRSYCCVDLDRICAQKPLVINMLLNSIVQFCGQNWIRPISPVHVFQPNKIQEAFTFMQPGSHIGKVVVEFPRPFPAPHANLGLQTVRNKIEAKFESSASYLLVGGLGGLGRAIAIWMVERGARHLVFLSPSAGTRVIHEDLIHELKSMASDVQLVKGNVSEASDVRKALAAAASSGPVKGVFQMSMVLRDQAFSRMSLEDWNLATRPKIQGTWNLHHELALIEAEIDFFVLFSSITALIGQPGQANYSSANTFLDAFVDYRTSLGLPVSAINIGSVQEIGFVAENDETHRKFTAMGLHGVTEKSLFDALTLSITVGRQEKQSEFPETFVNHRNFVLGLGSTSPINADSNATIWKDLRMAAYHNSDLSNTEVSVPNDSLSTFLVSAQADPSILSAPESSTLLAMEIGKKLYNFLLKTEEELDTKLSLSALGMDSLVAVEVRAWWRRTFGFDVTVLEMLQMGTLDALGKYAAEKLEGK